MWYRFRLFTSLTIYGLCVASSLQHFRVSFCATRFAFWQLPKKDRGTESYQLRRYFCEWTAAARHQPLNERRQKIFLHENVTEKQAKFWESLTDLQMSQQQKNIFFISALDGKNARNEENLTRASALKETLINEISRNVWNKTWKLFSSSAALKRND